ncbi:serine protease [bacterium]|nr:serine protease [bacterium]
MQTARTLALTCFFLFLSVFSLQADQTKEAGKEILNRWQDTVVTIEVVIETRSIVEGREMGKQESKNEITGILIDPSGLVVTSLYGLDITDVLEQTGSIEDDFRTESKIKELTLRLASGREIPAQVVLEDKDLDLAFIRPRKELANPLSAIDLTQDATPEILDQVILLDRLGKIADRIVHITLARIGGIITKPRTLYILDSSLWTMQFAMPVFSLEGKIIGVVLMRVKSLEMPMLPVVVPAEDILEVAKQILKE